MRGISTLVKLALVGSALGSSWFTKAAYNKWHETELERWLSDHDVPYPTPADRRDLEKLVQQNWDSYVVSPYQNWDTQQLSAYLQQKGIETKDSAAASKDSLVSQVQKNWYETEDKAQESYTSLKTWIFDSWSDSQLKAFCDYHGIPVPQPRKRDTLLAKARSSYDDVAKKLNEVSAYPGNWLYEKWTESDLKEWLDTNGFPAPQPTTRDKLIASVRRNSRLAYLKSQEQMASASSSAQAAYATLTDKIIDAWSESDLKDFADRNGIPVPQGTKVNELRALVRKNRADIIGDNVSGSAASAYGAATSKAGNTYASATDSASLAAQEAFDKAVSTWSESRLKSYLDARGVPVPQTSKVDELRALVRKYSHKAASGWTVWTFEDYNYENLKNYILANGDAAAKKVAEKSDATRADLVKAAQAAYASASSAGGDTLASATSYLSKATEAASNELFAKWSDSDLKSYLDSYGVPVPQGTKTNELRALARRQWTYYQYGTSSPSETIFAKLGENVKNTLNWVKDQLNIGADAAQKRMDDAQKKAKEEL
ncbi:hypothetical protein GGTG_09958 [Gaeumannomyces tritici R3-111a-1]|uniref:Meiotic sister chromatid recombination protein 1 n=1 Tax=Gaeumannomyces tritici (strain R3-111a-1) TaxID=644352 RepID=J3P8X3_GAET3|nr:hypothetical protein GGTG_09958 [Gaeumannomyces tritici R3-111a-1]EJT73108.1 hypothetical protein GGTG_09958 [Gaeumannomyces tritici R3-111a-1]